MCNVHSLERLMRIVLSLVMASAYFHSYDTWILVPAALLMATGALGWCPVYRAIGYSSNF